MSDRWPLPPLEMDIRMEVYRALQLAGADFIVLSLVGSWGDTLTDDEVLTELKAYNDGFRGTIIAQVED